MKEQKTRGVLLIGIGHSNYYRMAVVLAASIKVNEPDLPICFVTDNSIQIEHAHLFDCIVVPTEKSITQKGNTEYIKSKLFMYQFSPFDETIFLDVDQVMIDGRQLLPVFDALKDVDVTFSNTGPAGESIWADMAEVKSLYGDAPFWNFHSEFVYFKKCPVAKKYFDAAIKVYEQNKIKSATRFANATMADELAFQVAAMITGIYPHLANWLPNFWYDRDRSLATKYPYELEQYITYSIGGKLTPQRVKNNYNTLAKYYFAKLGLSHPYQVEDKINFLPERKMN